ncbi:MAG: hypothetical protein AAGD35_07230 [Actinomycetota bacterium]
MPTAAQFDHAAGIFRSAQADLNGLAGRFTVEGLSGGGLPGRLAARADAADAERRRLAGQMLLYAEMCFERAAYIRMLEAQWADYRAAERERDKEYGQWVSGGKDGNFDFDMPDKPEKAPEWADINKG